MSILIRGIEMPKNCSDCPLNYDQMMCIVTGTRWWSDTMMLMDFDSDKERLYDCPLVEVPTPHGRLIDADKLDCLSWHDTGGYFEDGVVWVLDKVDMLPTVIEAEGSEE